MKTLKPNASVSSPALVILLGLACLGLPHDACSQGSFPMHKIELLKVAANLTASDTATGDRFGIAVALYADTLVVGASGDDDRGTDSGSAYIFVHAGTNWVQQAKLTASDGAAGDQFGCDVAVHGDTVAVGAWCHAQYSGAVYVFERGGTNWYQMAKLTGPAGSGGFGDAIALSSDTLAVGALGSGKGPVCVYARSGTSWTGPQTLAPGGSQYQGDGFGHALALENNILVVGAPFDEYICSGAAYVFARNPATGIWGKFQEISGPATENGNFGDSVALSGGWLAIGNGNGGTQIFALGGIYWPQQTLATGEGSSSLAMNGNILAVSTTRNPPNANFSMKVFEWTGSTWELHRDFTYPQGVNTWSTERAAANGEAIAGGADAGQCVYIFAPLYDNAAEVDGYVRKYLYPTNAAASRYFEPWQAAFAYKQKLYGPGTNSAGAEVIRQQFEHITDYYGNAQRQRAAEAETELRKGLAFNPGSDILGHLLLDIYYDRTLAETVLARETLQKAERARFGGPGLTIAPPPEPGKFVIENELAAYDVVLRTNRFALSNYLTLLQSPEDSAIFRRLVPERGLDVATYAVTNAGVVTAIPVTTGDLALFSGYKDLVLLYELLGDYGQSGAALARLHLANGNQDGASQLLSATRQFLSVQSSLLQGQFPGLAPPADDPSGLAQAVAAVNDSLSDLENLRQNIRGNLNLLGFADDFLLLIKKGDDTDSFDTLRKYLDPDAPGLTPLLSARIELNWLQDHYATYRSCLDELAEQLSDSSITYNDRLRDIVGVFPDDPRYTDDPRANPGSDLYQQQIATDAARLRILRNSTEIDNLQKQVQIELAKAAAISNVMIHYGNQRANITEAIGHINAAQEGVKAMAEAEDPFTLLFNGLVQAGAEEAKGQLEAEKERCAALEQATIVGIETDATVKTLLLNMNILLIDSQEAALILRQELGRLEGLLREKKDLERKLAQRDSRLARRYFADPVHRLSVQAGMIRATLAFERARQYLFFMSRALEYKWNKKAWSAKDNYNRTHQSATLFKLRNARELEDFYKAMCFYDDSPDFSYSPTPMTDWFSVREDFFGFQRTNRLGQILYYTDPASGERLTAVQAFRRQLHRLHSDTDKLITLELSTVREIPGGTFFRGPRFLANGTMWSKGYFMDKIDSVMINLPGSHTLGYSRVTGQITYGGTSFLRNFSPGQLDRERQDRLRNEMTAYDTRHWFYDLNTDTWESTEAQSVPIVMQLSPDPRVPNEVLKNRSFKERGVAASRWTLLIPTWEGTTQLLDIDELDDIELYFEHHAMERP